MLDSLHCLLALLRYFYTYEQRLFSLEKNCAKTFSFVCFATMAQRDNVLKCHENINAEIACLCHENFLSYRLRNIVAVRIDCIITIVSLATTALMLCW